ncbi:MAG: hypothetical protein PHE55_05940 [Methylococcaceae bacterium]|nr:hypothetical protein [Methylococcaceae bacterium]
MSKNTYFQRMARQIDGSVPVLKPPRYLAMRTETTQFDTFARTGANQPSPRVNHPVTPLIASDHALEGEEVEDFSMAGHLSKEVRILPAAAIGSLTYEGLAGIGLEPNRESMLPPPSVPPLPSGENGHPGALERTAFSPTAAGNFSVDGLKSEPSSSLGENLPTQPSKPVPFPSFREMTDPLVAESAQPAAHPFSGMNSEDVIRRPSAVSAKGTGAISDPAHAMETDPLGSGYPHRGVETAKIPPKTAVNENVSEPNDGKTPSLMESPQGAKQQSRPDGDAEAVRIGVLEITIVSPPQATRQAETSSAPNKLSWARGISRAHGIRQG